ncbi:hypothetical protein LCGC14_2170250 [marine sediment metagenome]|uniref:Uncharacterized protein n=1 Tax=marine sediment metagenome TaxID=412755 RepID=A0A0F9GL96_9ZZZZ
MITPELILIVTLNVLPPLWWLCVNLKPKPQPMPRSRRAQRRVIRRYARNLARRQSRMARRFK